VKVYYGLKEDEKVGAIIKLKVLKEIE